MVYAEMHGADELLKKDRLSSTHSLMQAARKRCKVQFRSIFATDCDGVLYRQGGWSSLCVVAEHVGLLHECGQVRQRTRRRSKGNTFFSSGIPCAASGSFAFGARASSLHHHDSW